jgi:hypothetical protein
LKSPTCSIAEVPAHHGAAQWTEARHSKIAASNVKEQPMNGFIKATAVCAISMLMPIVGHAGNSWGTVSEMLILQAYQNLVFVKVTGPNAALPGCSNVGNRYVLDTTTNTGRQIAAALLAAKHAGAEITLIGGGTCNQVSNSEDLIGISQ